jgi:FtsP/CotA-like multicopper oxidase with cupredoxin domain
MHVGELPSRRTFLGAAAAAGLTAFVGPWPSRRAWADTTGAVWPLGPRWELEAVRVESSFADGSTIPFFGYRSLPGTPSAGALPRLEATEHTIPYMSITNRLDFAIQPIVIGLEEGPTIEPGESRHMLFRMPRAGTWLLGEGLLGRVAGPVGFGATLVSRARRQLSPPDREYVLVYQDADDRWNLDVDNGIDPDDSLYEPNFHTLNGLSFPDSASDPDTRVVCEVGERILLRIANLGHVRQAIHFHGYHVEVAARDNVRESSLGSKDTLGVPGHTTAECILHVNQPGVFPIHPHSLTMVTDNGLYPHGQITLIEAT